jgi:hypothetical protein
MAADVEASVAQIGLRDFLFYVVPGAVFLAGFSALVGVSARDLQPYLGISVSLAGILLSYIVGQCAYPLSYVIRTIMNKFGALRSLPRERSPTFIAMYRTLARDHPTFFSVEIFRYRIMARFCSVMVFPFLFAAWGVYRSPWGLSVEWRTGGWIVAMLVCVGFLLRYYRYEDRYRSSVANSGVPEHARDPGTS